MNNQKTSLKPQIPAFLVGDVITSAFYELNY